jgi:hypothetical protein
MRLEQLSSECLISSYFNLQEFLKALKEELDFKNFLELKSKWFKNLRIEWLIAGHLTQDEALAII